MKTLRGVGALLLVAVPVILLSACAPKVNDPADVQAIRQSVEAYEKAVNGKDATAIVALMTDKTEWSEPHMPAVVGKDAIGKLHQGVFDQGDLKNAVPVADVRAVGDLGFARGTWTQTFTPKAEGVASVSNSGNWMVVLQRQSDGSWKWDSLVVNSDQPMPGTTADGADEKALMQIEHDWAAALSKADVAALDRILAKEWTTNADGQVGTRAQVLAALKSGAYKLESVNLHDLTVHVFGDAAVATMTADLKGTFTGKPIPPSQRSTDFFVKRDGRWQAISTQNTTIKP
jgi:uncharacterized protein (TIGR02246 family)